MDRKRGFAVLPAKVSASKAHGSFLSVSFSSWTSQKWLLGLETHWSRPHPHQCQVMSPRSLALPPVCTRCHSAFLAPEHSASPPFILAASRVGTRHGRVCHDVLGCDTSQGEKVPVCRNGCQSLHPACPAGFLLPCVGLSSGQSPTHHLLLCCYSLFTAVLGKQVRSIIL